MIALMVTVSWWHSSAPHKYHWFQFGKKIPENSSKNNIQIKLPVLSDLPRRLCRNSTTNQNYVPVEKYVIYYGWDDGQWPTKNCE